MIQLLRRGAFNVVFNNTALGSFVDGVGDLEVGDLTRFPCLFVAVQILGVTVTALKPLP